MPTRFHATSSRLVEHSPVSFFRPPRTLRSQSIAEDVTAADRHAREDAGRGGRKPLVVLEFNLRSWCRVREAEICTSRLTIRFPDFRRRASSRAGGASASNTFTMSDVLTALRPYVDVSQTTLAVATGAILFNPVFWK